MPSLFHLLPGLALLNAPFVCRGCFSVVQEKRKLQDETDVMAGRLQEETESRRKMADKLSHERHRSQKEKECTQEVGRLSINIFVLCEMFLDSIINCLEDSQ